MHKFRSTAIHPIGPEIISKRLVCGREQSLAARTTQCFFITQILHECQITRVLPLMLQILVDVLTQPSRSLIVIDVVVFARTEQRQAHCGTEASV